MTEQLSKTILVVDDDRMFLDSVEQFLLQRGYYSRIAMDADSALKIIRDFAIDVVVADVVMPGKDGIQMMNEAKAVFPDMDFIIMTGHSAEHSYVEIINAGAADYLVKPFEMMELVARIERIKREKRLIREFKSTNQQLQEKVTQVNLMVSELRQTSRAKSNLLASISHEIRTPLTGILGFTDILLSTKLSREQESYAGNIKMSGEVLLSLLNDLLDSSKIEAGKMKLENIVFDPEAVCFDVCDLIRPRLYRKPVELVCRIDDNVPSQVYGDQHRFRQVLLNLMSNAAKFTPAGEVVLSLGASFDRDHQDVVRILVTVKDTGIGLSAADMTDLFAPFRQFHDTAFRKYGGTGLGLFLCKNIAELMDGDIRVESEPGRGSAFYFTARMKAVDGSAPKDYSLSGMPAGRILVVDNNQSNLETILHVLEKAGMKVEVRDSCENIREIFERAEKSGEPFDLCIIEAALASDVQGDFSHVRRMRQADSPLNRIPMIAISDPFIGNADKCQEAGFNGFLPKPVRRDRLFRMISRLVKAGGGKSAAEEPVRERTDREDADSDIKPGGTILLVEDNPVNRKLVAAMLKKAGYSLEMVEDGRTAVDRYVSAPDDYSLVLMDVQMPGMDGITAVKKIRQWEADQGRANVVSGSTPRHVRIIAVTAGAADNEKEKYVEAGMDDLLAKPIQRETLLTMVEKWLGQTKKIRVKPVHDDAAGGND